MKKTSIILKIRILLILVVLCVCLGLETAGIQPPESNARVIMVDPVIDEQEPFCYLAKSSTCLTVIAAQKGTQLTFDGAFYTGGMELCFFYGYLLKPVMCRQKYLLDGWMPIVSYSWKDGDIVYNVEAFANTLDGNPQSNLINFVKVEIQNTGLQNSKAHFVSATRFSGGDHRFERMKPFQFLPDWVYEMTDNALIRDKKLILVFPEGLEKEIVPGIPYTSSFKGNDYNITDRSEVGLLRFNKELSPNEKKTLIFKFPFFPVAVEDTEQVQLILKADYNEFRQKTVDLWTNEMMKGAQLSLPEEKVMNTHRASLMYTWEAIWQKDGKWVQGVNKFQYNYFWLRDAAYIIHCNDVWGHHEIARKTLEIYPEYQNVEGLFSSHKGQLDGFGQALYALGQHAIITGDKAYAEQIYKYFPKAIEWLKKVRSEDLFHIMPYTMVFDNEFIQGHYTGHNFWALLGLRTAIRIAKMIGNENDAGMFLEEYENFKSAFMKKLDEVAGKNGYIPPGLDAEGGQDWGNLLGLFPSEVLSPFDPRISTTLKKMHQEKFQEGLMTYMGRLHHYLTAKETENHIIRGEQEEALRHFYSILQHTGATNEMFEWQAVPWGDRDVGGNYPPHGWGAAMYNLLLRNMLVIERGGKGGLEPREIHLFSVISPAWAIPGKEISLRNAPTEHGLISFSMKFNDNGAEIRIDKKIRTQPKNIVIHIPYFVELRNFKADSKALYIEDGGIVFDPDVSKITLKWKRKDVDPLSYEKAVVDYKKEYARRYAEYLSAGNIPGPTEAPRLLSNEERQEEFYSLYSPQKIGIAIGKPVKASGEPQSDHFPELAVDGNAVDKDKSSW